MIKALDTFLASMRTAGKKKWMTMEKAELFSPSLLSPDPVCTVLGPKLVPNLYWFAGYSWQQNAREVTAVMV